jgi:hypothetical protein
LTGINGGTLRDWRRSRGWDVPKTARELRRVASEPVAAPDVLVRMIRGWERGDHELSERYELLYRRLGMKTAQPDPGMAEERFWYVPEEVLAFPVVASCTSGQIRVPGAGAG